MGTETAILAIVIPCYNEELVLRKTIPEYKRYLQNLISEKIVSEKSYIMLIDDGSTDKTWSIIEEYSKHKNIKGIRLTRNVGHQNAIWCGMMEAKDTDAVVTIDCDGQDDIKVIGNMLDAYYNDDANIVLAVRNNRDTDNFFKRKTAELYYKINKSLIKETVYNHADYRFMDRQALDLLSKYDESNLYIRGMVHLLGLNVQIVYYKRQTRKGGKTHYTLSKMLDLALNGITSFTNKPLRGITVTGIYMVILSIILGIIGIFSPNINLIHIIICLLVSVNTICVGIMGEYVGKNYIETKHRPKYHIWYKTKEANNEKET